MYDEDGQCVAYVGADISLNNFSTYIRHFIIRMILVFSGFFVLILAYGFSLSDHYLVYPISSLENSIDGFMQGIDEQEMGRRLKPLYGNTYWWYYYFYNDFDIY